MSQMFRQGDVLLVECELPENARFLPRRGVRGGIILAAGEATGHHHRIRDRHSRRFRGGGGRTFIRTSKHGATVTHEEHDSIVLPAGKTFEVVRQREYNPPKDKQRPAPTTYVRD